MSVLSGARLSAALVRVLLGGALATAVKAASGLLTGQPGLGILDLEAAAAFVAGCLFGPAGAVGAGLAVLGRALLSQGVAPALLFGPAHALLGLAGFAAFRWLPAAGRRLPNLRSCVALFAGGAAGGLVAALLAAAAMPGSLFWRKVGFWWAAEITSVLIAAPPLLLGLAPLLERWLAPIPGEVRPASFPPWLQVEWREAAPESGAAGTGSRRRGPRAWLLPVALALALSVLAWLAGPRTPAGVEWFDLLLVVPLLVAALQLGVHGGVLFASWASASHLLVRQIDPGAVEAWHWGALADQSSVVLFFLLGAALGSGCQREGRLRQQLTDANERLRQDLARTVRALRSAVAAKDAYTEGHLHRVASYAVAVGQRLGLAGRDLELLEMASLLHDVGKIGIPEAILLKPGPLTAEEMDWMKRHPAIGAQILDDVEGLRDAAPLVLYHQERFDGQQGGTFPGYPEGLKGLDIPLGARIIAVVDAFDAMTSDRPYRPAKTVAEARAVLREERARQFDPEVVDAFLGVLAEQPW